MVGYEGPKVKGALLSITDHKAGGTQTQSFTYDALDRLASAVASGGTGGTYGLQNYTYNLDTGNLASCRVRSLEHTALRKLMYNFRMPNYRVLVSIGE